MPSIALELAPLKYSTSCPINPSIIPSPTFEECFFPPIIKVLEDSEFECMKSKVAVTLFIVTSLSGPSYPALRIKISPYPAMDSALTS